MFSKPLGLTLLAVARSLVAAGISLATDGGGAAGARDLASPPSLLQLSAAAGSTSASEAARSSIAGVLDPDEDCNLCHGKQDWLFILGTGRSGSTTALEMVDAIPGVYLAGENFGIMNTLMELYETHQIHLSKEAVSENRVLCALQKFVKTIIGEFDEEATKVIGFKEIRHVTATQLAFFKKVFPGARFLINTRRNLERQHQSQFQMDIPMEELKNWTFELELFQKQNPSDTFELHLEDYSRDLFNRMLRFLGVTGCFYNHIAHANHGWKWNDDEEIAKKGVAGECSIASWEKVGCDGGNKTNLMLRKGRTFIKPNASDLESTVRFLDQIRAMHWSRH